MLRSGELEGAGQFMTCPAEFRVSRSPVPGRDRPVHHAADLPGGHARGIVAGREPDRVQRRSMNYALIPARRRRSRASPAASYAGLCRDRRCDTEPAAGRYGLPEATSRSHPLPAPAAGPRHAAARPRPVRCVADRCRCVRGPARHSRCRGGKVRVMNDTEPGGPSLFHERRHRAVGVAAVKATHDQHERHRPSADRLVRHASHVAAVHPLRPHRAHPARSARRTGPRETVTPSCATSAPSTTSPPGCSSNASRSTEHWRHDHRPRSPPVTGPRNPRQSPSRRAPSTSAANRPAIRGTSAKDPARCVPRFVGRGQSSGPNARVRPALNAGELCCYLRRSEVAGSSVPGPCWVSGAVTALVL